MSALRDRLTSTPVKVGGFVVAVAAVFGLALAVGAYAGPVAEPVAAHDDAHPTDEQGEHGDHAAGADADAGATVDEPPGGLQVSEDGYTLRLTETRLAPGRDRPISFVVEGPDGEPVTDYDVEHDKDLHLIVVRRDFTGFQHVHPTLDAAGTWRVPVDLTAGTWRVFADFTPEGGEALTLGSDLAVTGTPEPDATLPESRTATVDGYTVTLAGDLVAGEHSMLTLSVERDGEPVTDLQPYLGAYGHLVALREGDLAYLHVHPDGEPGDGTTKPGPDVVFGAEVPSRATYHLYLDFRHDGVVRTAPFTLATTGGRS